MQDARPSKDSWHGVHDLKERKKIQDRLAQRARRKRLADARRAKNASAPVDDDTVEKTVVRPADDNAVGGSTAHPAQDPARAYATPRDSTASPSTSEDASDTQAQHAPWDLCRAGGPKIDPTPANISVFAALFRNGQYLGLTCGTCVPGKSPPAGPACPAPLRPTLLQLAAVHFRWIDRFPFEDCRDEMILRGSGPGGFDEDDFLADIFAMPSFVVEGESWDPSGWTMVEGPFKERWGSLFPYFTGRRGLEGPPMVV
ncbi:MAG: DUF3425 domain-containing protein [Terriglobus roseus]|nr:DUF3425 domain-containing protein [Terriglobus roseus]